jgi:hypothetical protein
MKCWICKTREANSREHKLKASDLKAVFPTASQKSPLVFDDGHRHHHVGSINNRRFKFEPLMCDDCNNRRTQKHDKAWELLSKYLRGHQPPIRNGSRINLKNVFPGKVHQSMLHVHLFFLKHLGSRLLETNVAIDVFSLSDSILNEKPHPGVWLEFKYFPGMPIAGTYIQLKHSQVKVEYAICYYRIDRLVISFIYAAPDVPIRLFNTWHPSNKSTIIRFSKR